MVISFRKIYFCIFGFIFISCHTPTMYSTPMETSYLLVLLDHLKEGNNFIFTKYGDGEYFCMIERQGANIDHDSYNKWLGTELKRALIELCQKPNTYIGKWWHSPMHDYCDELARQHNVTVPWAWYHLFMNDDQFFKHNYMYKFVEFITNTPRKKILICNHMNARLQHFFRADAYIEIPSKNWSREYRKWKNTIEPHLEKDAILLISGGMCSKVLINDITNQYDVTCIDLGSSFDLLARKKKSRAWRHSYQDEIKYYQNLLPTGWK